MRTQFIMSVKNGIVEKTSVLARRHIMPQKLITENRIMTNFLRESENFKPRFDGNDIFPTYDTNDLPIANSLNRNLHRKSNEIGSKYFDTDIQVAKIIDTKETVYLEKAMENETCARYLNEGFSFKDVANILHKAKKYPTANYIYEAFELMKAGYPLELVLKYMDDALLKTTPMYSSGMLEFVAQNPGKKSLVIVKNLLNRNEVLDTYAMKHFHILETTCNSETEIKSILRACRCTNKEGTPLTNEYLFDLALEIRNKNNAWTRTDEELFDVIKVYKDKLDFQEESLDYQLYRKVHSYLEQGKSSKEILEKIKKSSNN